MTTTGLMDVWKILQVVEAYRLDRYDNTKLTLVCGDINVVEAYRLDRYDNDLYAHAGAVGRVVEAYRLDRYDNKAHIITGIHRNEL